MFLVNATREWAANYREEKIYETLVGNLNGISQGYVGGSKDNLRDIYLKDSFIPREIILCNIQSSQVSCTERETHVNKFSLMLSRWNYYFSRI